MLSLLTRLYDAQGGQVTIGGTRIDLLKIRAATSHWAQGQSAVGGSETVHRLSAITHADLLAQEELYAGMYGAQKQSYG